MSLFQYRAFATELMKIATELQDPDIRALMAQRKGEEYLKGGQLPTNADAEGQDSRYVPELQKKAFGIGYEAGALPPDDYMVRGKLKKPGMYQDVRDTAVAGMKGALTGAGVTGLYHGLRGRMNTLPTGQLQAGAGIGAGLALADRMYRHHQQKRQLQEEAVKQANLSTFTPARALDTGHKVGSFENKVHVGAPAQPAGLMGKAGRLPK
jgi:hypothetical protein